MEEGGQEGGKRTRKEGGGGEGKEGEVISYIHLNVVMKIQLSIFHLQFFRKKGKEEREWRG